MIGGLIFICLLVWGIFEAKKLMNQDGGLG